MSRAFDICRNLSGIRKVAVFAASILLLPLTAIPVEAQPPRGRDSQTIRGTVRSFTTAPKGEVDGAVLDDGAVVHWPPHQGERITGIIAKGDRVRVTGRREKSPEGDSKLEDRNITNLRTNDSVSVEDAPAPGRRAGKKPPPPPGAARRPERTDRGEGVARNVRGTVRRFTTAPKGETDGAVLDDGTTLHWPPHMQDRFTDVVKKGDRVRATGRTETGPAGDTHFEIQSVTNLGSNATARNPDFAAAPAPPPDGPRRLARDRAGDVEQRLQALEDKIDQLQKEIDRLRRNR